MERVAALRQQAAALRQLAERTSPYPELNRRMLALAQQCEELADSLSETLSTEE